MPRDLPIWKIGSQIIQALESAPRLVIVAPTGSGKTTQVPQMLLDAGIPRGKRVVTLQPRRIAARSVAARVAWERKTRLGGLVGYQIRFDDRLSEATSLCYITDGILLRWLQRDAALSDVGVLVFDEFHERNLLSDVGLGLVKGLQERRRPDLKIVVMSATLEAAPVAEYLGQGSAGSPVSPTEGSSSEFHCPILATSGRGYPVEVRYLEKEPQVPVWDQAAEAVRRIASTKQEGDILVFMPGLYEIRATINSIQAEPIKEPLVLVPLHGDLPSEEQDRAFIPSLHRKVVVATNVAETSVTIPGIRHVVDSGLARISRFDPYRGLTTLLVEPISQDAADQRAGRAGRTAPGTCQRLWTERNQRNRSKANTPEIKRSDLAEVVLLLHSLGVRNATRFDWLDRPGEAAVKRADRLLWILGALAPATHNRDLGRLSEARPDEAFDLSEIGRVMLRLPMHPRLSRMLVEALQYDCLPPVALCAALVSGRDLLPAMRRREQPVAEARELFESDPRSDFFTLLRAFQFAKKSGFGAAKCRRYGINPRAAVFVERTYRQIMDLMKGMTEGTRMKAPRPAGAAIDPDEALLRSLMTGFVDQLCQRRDASTLECSVTENRRGTLARESAVKHAELFVATHIRRMVSSSRGEQTLLNRASLVRQAWLEASFPQHVVTRIIHEYDPVKKRVVATRQTLFLDLAIRSEQSEKLDPIESGRCLVQAWRDERLSLPLFNHEVKQWIARVHLVSAWYPELGLPTLDGARIDEQVAAALSGALSAREARKISIAGPFCGMLDPPQLERLDALAPVRLDWPNGKVRRIIYAEGCADPARPASFPEVQVRLHDCFGLQSHPSICEEKVPIRLVLQNPDGAKLGATTDWNAFKQETYPEMRSRLQNAYPEVGWP